MSFAHDQLFPPHETVSMAETTLQASTPDPSVCDSREDSDERKPVKKRKSWGQELPTPKTNLPPRKRAKTEDEKEQRRIERVLRNRQAAQSSRERKRQEVEKLEGEKHSIEDQNEMLRQRVLAAEHEKFQLQQQNAVLKAELTKLRDAIKSRGPSLAESPDLDLFQNQAPIKEEFDDPVYLRTPVSLPSESFSPSPPSSMVSRSPSPSSFDLNFDLLTASPDMTQHPAAVLCDLQCQSGTAPVATMTRPTARNEALHHSCNPANRNTPLINPSYYLILFTTVYSQLLIPLLQISLSLRTGSPLPTHATTHAATLRLIRWLILTPANLMTPLSIPRSTTTASSPATKASSMTTTPSRPIFRTRLLRRLLLCSPALARPLLGATVRAMRAERGVVLTERTVRGRGVESEASWSRLMMLALAIECITKGSERSCMSRSKDQDLGRGLAYSLV
ncbi:MAG: hypothetical protein Q9169_004952 [Polycauliona sp. 2 TL-2023]